jgi:hypothetical protein
MNSYLAEFFNDIGPIASFAASAQKRSGLSQNL